MMIFMMFGMRRTHGQVGGSNQSQSDWSLHQDYNEIKVQNEQLKKEIGKLSIN